MLPSDFDPLAGETNTNGPLSLGVPIWMQA